MRVEIFQPDSSGLIVSLKTKIFGLRVPQEEIFQSKKYANSKNQKNYTNFQMGTLSDWNIIFWNKFYFGTALEHNIRYFERSLSGSIFRK